MSASLISGVMQDAIMVILKCSLPMMLAALLIGVIISIFQAATQINEQTLSFVPKIIGVFLTLLVTIGYIIAETTGFMTRLYEMAAGLGI
ncbi:flagellar biosynthetic protein FliQ [Christensenellaceae bacterium OttesenSCG-928-M15]|nr:flagellar biosynthetic protein FliQ [Christensenellaceae bacterium OttesenSCG-928-M15]